MKEPARRQLNKSMTPRRRFIFTVLALLLPVFVLAALEFSLRYFRYGPDLSLFKVETVNGRLYYTLNPSIKNRYFGGTNFEPSPSPELFLVSKPAGTFRIICLGESSTIGYPYWYNGAFPSFLRDRLKSLFPDRSVEVVNLGITATNSFAVLDISRTVMDYAPDLLIVYDGHNEFYGMLGAASNERIASARWITLLYLRMIHLRTFQLVKNGVDGLFNLFGKPGEPSADRTTLMEHVARGQYIPYGSDIYHTAFETFKENLEDLCDLCRDRNVPLILGTQVSNIRDQNPFVSNISPHRSEQERGRFQQLYEKGKLFQAEGNLDSAVICFRSAISLDSLYADVHYRLAQSLSARGNNTEAYREFMLARDYDELRFRTDSKFNDLIRSMTNIKGAYVADIEAVFRSLSEDSLIGRNLVLEHLHPNSRGSYYIAREYSRVMCDHGLMASSGDWMAHDTLSEDIIWRSRHVTELDEMLAARKTEYLTSGWPFRSQPSTVAPVKQSDTLRFIVEQLVHGQINWENAHSRAIEYYLQRNEITNAENEGESIIDQFPLDIPSYLRLAQIYFSHSEFLKAETTLLASLRVQPFPLTFRMLGDTYLKEGKLESAIHCYEEVNKFPANPDIAAENAYMLAVAYVMSDKLGPAVRILEQLLDHYPRYARARALLSKIGSLTKTRSPK